MLIANPQTLFQKLGDEAVILHMQSEQYFGLDIVGARFWEILTEKKDLEAVYAVLLDEFDVDELTLRNDIQELIEQLISVGLLQYN